MNIVILTGAGISAESGIRTFRDTDGLWEEHDIMDVATPQAFARDPVRVNRFYDIRRAQLDEVSPNAAHVALARLQREGSTPVTLVTQNVDDLHERAGSDVIHMHGELIKAHCVAQQHVMPWRGPLSGATCPICSATMRPHIVWFGEMPMHVERIEAAIAACDLFVAIGTSGEVYPAAGFVDLARSVGARTLEINLEPTYASLFDQVIEGPATREVARWVEGMLRA